MSIGARTIPAKTTLGVRPRAGATGLKRVLALVAYPFCYAIYLSMTRKFVGMPAVFVGFENYVRLASDGFFLRAVWNSVIFTFGSVVFKLMLGMAMALVLTSNIRFRSLFTGIL